MTAADLHAAPHEPRCGRRMLLIGPRCIRAAEHSCGCIYISGSFADDGHKEGGHG